MQKNLSDNEALKKFTSLVSEIRTCMFITNNTADNSESFDHTRPMGTTKVEDDGTLWFFTDIRSIKVEEISLEHKVHLVYAHPGKASYLDVWGNATVVTDRESIKDKWSPIVKAWFPDGVDDPNLALLRVSPQKAYYWDAESGKMVAFLKIAAAAVVGQRLSEGAEGKLAL